MFKTLRFSLLSMLVMLCGTVMADEVTDVLNNSAIGVTGTTYKETSDISVTSDAVYAAQSAGGNESIQLRSNNNNSGIVSTKSGGKVKSITITFNSNTNSARVVSVYGSNTAYTIPADLYDTEKQGTLLGEIAMSDPQTITVNGDYEYVGIRSKSGALYIDELKIVWETGAAVTKTAKPVIEPRGGNFFESIEVTLNHEDEEASIFYTLNSEDWNTAQEAEPGTKLTLRETTVLRAKAFDYENDWSDVVTYTFTKQELSTLAQAQAAEKGTTVAVEGTVVASAANGAVLSDGTDYLYYYNPANDLTVGQKVRMVGALSTYGGANQLTSTAEVTVLGEETVTHPAAVELTGAEMDEIQTAKVAERKYVSFTGTLAINGNYFNITVDGAETAVASIVKPNEDLSELDGMNVKVTGYLMYVNSKYVYVVATSVEEDKEDTEEVKYYVAGSMNDWKVDAAYKMTQNSKAAEGIKEFFFTTTLEAGAEFKVVSSENGIDIKNWFPSEGNNYVVETAGEYTIYFRPNQDGGDDWYSKYIYVASNETPEPQPIETVGEGTLENPYTAADAIKVAGALEQGSTSEDDYYVKGKISSIKYEFNASFGTATFSISDDGEAANEFLCYGVYYLENKSWQEGDTQIKVGDEVILFGKLTNYNGTPETASKKAYIYSLTSAEIIPELSFYVVGSMTEWAIDANNKMTQNDKAAEGIKEFFFTTTLEAGAKFKVVSSYDGNKIESWFPEGNDYVIETAGEYTIYFRPNYDGGDDWYGKCIYVEAKAAPADVTIVTFDFNASDHAVSDNDGGKDGDITENEVLTVDGVTMTISPAEEGTANRYWDTKNGPQLRMYSGTMTITAPDGKAITKATFNNGKWNTGNTFNGVAAETGEWEGNSTSLILTVAGNTQINSVVLTISNANEQTTTGIVAVKADNHMEGIFNLNGQKVMKAQKGLYIINGKKVVLK